MSEWRDTLGAFDWQDGGKKIEVLLADGKTLIGTLWVDDVLSGGDDGEIPMFKVEFEDGSKASPFDFDKFRFVAPLSREVTR